MTARDALDADPAAAEIGPLRRVLEASGLPLGEGTVLATCNDPYRVDTPAGHRDASWLAVHLDRLVGANRRIHLRGLHYALVATGDVVRPNGELYTNTDACWSWLAIPAKAARWLGYVGFDRLVDARNSEPVIHRKAQAEIETWVSVGLDVEIPDADDIEPYAGVSGFEARQPYHLVIFGEKTSLSDVLVPIGGRFGADIYLPSGEISDTLLWQMARDGATDGRPMRVFTLADCDPSGH